MSGPGSRDMSRRRPLIRRPRPYGWIELLTVREEPDRPDRFDNNMPSAFAAFAALCFARRESSFLGIVRAFSSVDPTSPSRRQKNSGPRTKRYPVRSDTTAKPSLAPTDQYRNGRAGKQSSDRSLQNSPRAA